MRIHQYIDLNLMIIIDLCTMFTFLFTAVNEEVEILNAMTGKQESGPVSRLSKASFMSSFLRLLHLRQAPSGLSYETASELDYHGLKGMSVSYTVSYRIEENRAYVCVCVCGCVG